jgi:hypothetical protein
VRYQPRHRSAIRRSQSAIGLAAAGLIAGAAVMLLSGSANADSVQPGTVSFSGNCGALRLALAESVPSQSNLAVPAASTVTLVNNLPCGAHLYLDGSAGPAIDEGAKYTYKAATGDTKIQMVPDGLNLLSTFSPATVTGQKVAASPSPSSGGSSGTGNGGSGNSGSGNSGSSGDQHSGSGTEGASAPPSQPAPGESPSVDVHQPVARGAVPSGAAAPGTGSGTSGGGGDTSTSGTGHDPTQVRAVSDTSPSGATSVLALIAAVCLFGVGAVAVRTVLSQRRHFRAQHI